MKFTYLGLSLALLFACSDDPGADPVDAGDGAQHDGGDPAPDSGARRDGGPDPAHDSGIGRVDAGPLPPGARGTRPDGPLPEAGRFVSTLIDETGVHVQGVVPVDLDGDSNLDLVAAFSSSDTFAIYDGAAGVFTRRDLAPINTLIAIRSAVADLDGDGDLDIAGVTLAIRGGTDFYNSGQLLWFENPGNLTTAWTRHDITGGIDFGRHVVAADFDGDGRSDLAVAGGEFFTLTTYRNLGTGFAAGVAVDAEYQRVTALFAFDVNDDQKIDLVGATETGEITWFENQRSGTGGQAPFARRPIATARRPIGIAIGQLDLDSEPELTALIDDSRTVWFDPVALREPWTLREIDADFGSAPGKDAMGRFRSGEGWTALADLNGDGYLDVAASSGSRAELRIYLNDPRGPWLMRSVTNTLTGLNSMTTGDVDGDGRPDLITGTYEFASAVDRLEWFRNTP